MIIGSGDRTSTAAMLSKNLQGLNGLEKLGKQVDKDAISDATATEIEKVTDMTTDAMEGVSGNIGGLLNVRA